MEEITYPIFFGTGKVYANRGKIYSGENAKCMLFFSGLFISSLFILAGIVYGIDYAIDVDLYNMTRDNIMVCNTGFSGCILIAFAVILVALLILCFALCIYYNAYQKYNSDVYDTIN
jgi:hypothetical protein